MPARDSRLHEHEAPLTPELFVLTALSALSHFWRLFTPNAVVFDEAALQAFRRTLSRSTRSTSTSIRRWRICSTRRWRGSPASRRETLLGDAPVPVLRVLPAFCGTLVVPLGYVMLRQLGAARRVATLAGLALLFENALLVDTRLALVEPLHHLRRPWRARRCTWRRAEFRRAAAMGVLRARAHCSPASRFRSSGPARRPLGMILALWAADVWRARKLVSAGDRRGGRARRDSGRRLRRDVRGALRAADAHGRGRGGTCRPRFAGR